MADGVATKKDPKKWAAAKSRAKAKMGGKHSARAMQLATKYYKDGGGGYEGKKPSAKNNKMKKWTKEDWGTKSGKNSTEGKGATGERYLPKKKRGRHERQGVRTHYCKETSRYSQGQAVVSKQPRLT